MEVAAINDLTEPKMLAHHTRSRVVQGRYEGHQVEWDDCSITVDGKKIPVFAEKEPAKLPWRDLHIDIVLECTGFLLPRPNRRLISRREPRRC